MLVKLFYLITVESEYDRLNDKCQELMAQDKAKSAKRKNKENHDGTKKQRKSAIESQSQWRKSLDLSNKTNTKTAEKPVQHQSQKEKPNNPNCDMRQADPKSTNDHGFVQEDLTNSSDGDKIGNEEEQTPEILTVEVDPLLVNPHPNDPDNHPPNPLHDHQNQENVPDNHGNEERNSTLQFTHPGPGVSLMQLQEVLNF